MAIRLSRKLFESRDIPIGYGVSFTFAPFGYADYKEAEARAGRMARDRLSQVDTIKLETTDDEDLGPEFAEKMIGLSAEILLDSLVMKYATSWSGVFYEKKNPDDPEEADIAMPLTPESWEGFRSELPLMADILDRKLVMPMHVIVTEGNASAPLPSGDTQAG